MNRPMSYSSTEAATTVRWILAEDVKFLQQLEQEEAEVRKRFEPWQRMTDDGQDRLLYKTNAKELDEAWTLFRNQIPNDERIVFDQRNTPFEDVQRLMQNVATKWERDRNKGKAGAICRWYRKCCLCIKSHETMLKILPEGDKYFSLFTGVLKSVVFATANHEKIALGLSQAIATISETIHSCSELREMYDTQRVQELTMDLYAHVFKLLRDILKWYLDKVWKRLIKSFSEDLFDLFENQVDSIKEIAESINKAAFLGQAGELRFTRLRVQAMEQRQEAMQQSFEDLAIMQLKSEEARLKREEVLDIRQQTFATHIAGLIQTSFEETAKTFSSAHFLMCPPASQLLLHSASAEGLRGASGNVVELHEVTRGSMLVASKNLEDFFERNRVRIPFDPATVAVHNDAMGKLQKWASAKNSSILCITGSEASHSLGASPMSALAAKIINFVDDSKLPVISYFCGRKGSKTQDQTSAHSQGAASLIYALLRQALELLSPTMEATEDMSVVADLDGGLSSFDRVMGLFETALQNGKPLVYCIIDGLQDIEDRTTLKYLEKLVKLLKRRANAIGEQPVKLKVLFPSSGRCRSLVRNLARSEIVLADDIGNSARNLRDTQPLMLTKRGTRKSG